MSHPFKKLSLGIELGSTRIKSVLIDENQQVVGSGSHTWENQLIDGLWTYSIENVWSGLQASYADLKQDVQTNHGFKLTKIDAIGFSAMMHGYLAFNNQDELLVPFRTWRNANTLEAEEKLTELFNFNIPARWSIAHYYQAILNNEPHVKDVDFLTTLAGYVHWQLTEEKVLGVGDASGMFPIDPKTMDYNAKMMDLFETDHGPLKQKLPRILTAGQVAGVVTEKGVKLLDPSGELEPGIKAAPPEGDAGTGMVATNSVRQRTGNISAGTSIFSMIVLEEDLKKVYPEIDVVTTPTGSPVAMVHANNCSSDINAWVGIFRDFVNAAGLQMDDAKLYGTLFNEALNGDADAGGLLSYGYLSGENITKMPEGRPLLVRSPESTFNLANLMRVNLYTAFGALNIGMKLLTEEEGVSIDKIFGHGGIFTTKGVAQRFLAASIDTPVTVMDTASEGGAWGIALLADFVGSSQTLEDHLDEVVFKDAAGTTIEPTREDVEGFETFVKRYVEGLDIQRKAIEKLI